MNPMSQVIIGVTLWMLLPVAVCVAVSRAAVRDPKEIKPQAPRPTTEDPWGIKDLPTPQNPYTSSTERKEDTMTRPITRPQDSITALCSYRKGFEDALSLLAYEDGEEKRAEEAELVLSAIDRKLRSKFHSAENGETRRIAARALSPVMAEIFADCAKKSKAMESKGKL